MCFSHNVHINGPQELNERHKEINTLQMCDGCTDISQLLYNKQLLMFILYWDTDNVFVLYYVQILWSITYSKLHFTQLQQIQTTF